MATGFVSYYEEKNDYFDDQEIDVTAFGPYVVAWFTLNNIHSIVHLNPISEEVTNISNHTNVFRNRNLSGECVCNITFPDFNFLSRVQIFQN